VKAIGGIGAHMENKQDLSNRSNTDLNLDVDTGNEGTEIGATAQGKRNIRSEACAYRRNHL
jgi:hypothetical protein